MAAGLRRDASALGAVFSSRSADQELSVSQGGTHNGKLKAGRLGGWGREGGLKLVSLNFLQRWDNEGSDSRFEGGWQRAYVRLRRNKNKRESLLDLSDFPHALAQLFPLF